MAEALKVNTAQDLFAAAEKYKLYQKLVVQVQKDFKLASIDLETPEGITPSRLRASVEDAVFYCLQKNTASYLNLLYIVDVPENAVKKLDASNTVVFSKAVAFLVLKRCWMKVWYKAKYA